MYWICQWWSFRIGGLGVRVVFNTGSTMLCDCGMSTL